MHVGKTYLIVGYKPNEHRAKKPCGICCCIGDSHNNRSISWRNVQHIDLESCIDYASGEASNTHTNDDDIRALYITRH